MQPHVLTLPAACAACCSYWDCPDAHLPVLQDSAYQAAWGRALEAAAPLLKGAVVLDVGCGLGTLAMAAAKVRGKHMADCWCCAAPSCHAA
jgi:cyclopropane fatty-acyl-phospholipid synthase-like methyltransferase